MQIAIIHYHLNRGGVTQVIANHLRSLDAALGGGQRWRVALLYGGRREGWPAGLSKQFTALDVSRCAIPQLDYDDGGPALPEDLHRQIRDALRKLNFSPGETLLHVHNHALGKNVSLPGALRLLAADGYRLLLQIHDFAEDLRPDVYGRLHRALSATDPVALAETLYPQSAGIHYAVLNQRDERILHRARFVASRVHLLANPVANPSQPGCREGARTRIEQTFKIPPDRQWVLYPVRGIARKNVGEMLLWSAAWADRASFGLTLPPLNPQQIPIYHRWTELAAELRLPCAFGVGTVDGLSFSDNLQAADMILSTSLAEGFGMTFLEAWLCGRYLIGRDLPEITADFVQAGVRLDSLRSRLDVPLAWIGRKEFRAEFLAAYHRLLDAYGRQHPDAAQLREAWAELEQDDCIDFGSLTPDPQSEVIRRIHRNAAARSQLLELNPWMMSAVSATSPERQRVIDENARVIQEHYSLPASGRRLLKLYETVLSDNTGADHELADPDAILNAFIHPARFRPVRIVE